MQKNQAINVIFDKTYLMSIFDFAEYLGKNTSFAKKMMSFFSQKTADEKFVDDNGEIRSVFYGFNENLKPKNLFIDKRAIPYFIKKYADDLEMLGVNPDYLKVLYYNIPRGEVGKEDVLNLWVVLSKISPNTKCVTELCRYAKEKYLTAEYPVMSETGHIKMEKAFIYMKGKAGRSGFSLKKAAYPYFMKRYKDDLKKEAMRLDANTHVIGLRALLRELNIMENKDLVLKEFILNNCLKDTFNVKDESGKEKKLPCFSYMNDRYLCIDKRCLSVFVSRYKKDLNLLGFNRFQHIIEDVPKIADGKKFFSLSSLGDILRSSVLKEKLKKLFDEKGVDYFKIKTTDGKEISFFEEYFYHGKKRYYLPKEKFISFLKTYSKELEDMGVRKEFIDDRSGGQKIPYKGPQMIVFDDFYISLTTDSRFHKELSQKIKTLFKDEKFEYKDENGVLHSENVFLKVRSGIAIATVFCHEAAMKNFVSKHRDFLMKNGIKKESIENLLGERKAINYSDEYIPLYDFPKIFHQSKRTIAKTVREKYLDETYQTIDEKGALVHRPMFVPMQRNSKGIIFYAMPKEALVPFARRHQEELHISDLVIEELSGNLKIFEKTAEFISLPDLFRGIVKNSRNSIAKGNKFIVQNCMNDMYISKNEAGTLISKPIFRYTRNKTSGTIALSVDINGVDTFFKHRKSELLAQGLYPGPICEKVKKSKILLKDFIMNRLKILGRV